MGKQLIVNYKNGNKVLGRWKSRWGNHAETEGWLQKMKAIWDLRQLFEYLLNLGF